jgi:hypothetical protein
VRSRRRLLLVWLGATALLAPSAAARADGPEVNPFECYGRYQAATQNRSVDEIRHELTQRLQWLNEPGLPGTVRAIRLCEIARLKTRLGDGDAYDYHLRAIAADPAEPGLELWAGQYWTGARGVRRPIAEPAEKHYYAALAKLQALRQTGRFREYHAIVEDWVRHDLLVLYQMDGLPLLPWKAYPQDARGLNAPGVAISSQLRVSRDTRDFFYNNEYRQFTGEAAFANSSVRAGGIPPDKALTARQRWDIPRAPLRLQTDNRLRIRQRHLGTFDVLHSFLHAYDSQIFDYYHPTAAFSDVTVQQLGGGYERVFPLYPLFDLRLAGDVQRVWRTGAIEFHPTADLPPWKETFNLYEFKPSVSRFLGVNKLVLNGVYALLDLPSTVGAPPAEALRQMVIRAATFEYGIYAPLVLPTFDYGTLSTYRTPTRGLYLFGGVMQIDDVYGTRTSTARDYYLGTRFEGPHWTDLLLQGTYSTENGTYLNPNVNPPVLFSDPALTFSSFRTSALLQYRVRSADTFPGVPPSHAGFASDMLHLVFPVSWDLKVTGRNDYENVRGGAQLWTKIFGTGLGGATFLVTAGYEAQYFYRIQKTIHTGQLAIRLGWGDL